MTLRTLALVYGAAALLWLSAEDNSIAPVVAFGAGLAGLFLIPRLALLRRLSMPYTLVGAGLLGAAFGLGTALATVGLMLLKTGLHSHLFPDYPPAQMLALLQRAPVWMLAGVLAGVGLALAWAALKER
jgi:hypothetical protein